MTVVFRRIGFFVLLLAGVAVGLYSLAALAVAAASIWRGGLQPVPADLHLSLLFLAVAVAGLFVAIGCGWGARRLHRQRG